MNCNASGEGHNSSDGEKKPDRSRSRPRRRGHSTGDVASGAGAVADASVSPCSRCEEGSEYSSEDEVVHFEWQKGSLLHSRYELVDLLGDGHFGRVLLALDQHNNVQVGIKVIRDVQKLRDDALIEADILSTIRDADVNKDSRNAILLDTFVHENIHFCFVFEALGLSLYDQVVMNLYRGFWMHDIQVIAHDCLKALSFLHSQVHISHTDLKLENILLETREEPKAVDFFSREEHWRKTHSPPAGLSRPYYRPASCRIKLIDFGNATRDSEHHAAIISTRQYRGAEVVLELGWNQSADIWSLGCILVELYTGGLLFSTHDDLEHLALMERIIGHQFSQAMLISKLARSLRYVVEDSVSGELRLRWPEGAPSSESVKFVEEQHRLTEHVMPEHTPLADFCGHLLKLDPAARPSAAEAMRHNYFERQFND